MENIYNYWNSRPCNIKHSTKEIGTKEYFDEVENKKYFVEPHILTFADFAKWKNKKVLEIGCGIGTACISFLKENLVDDLKLFISDTNLKSYGRNNIKKELKLILKNKSSYIEKVNLYGETLKSYIIK